MERRDTSPPTPAVAAWGDPAVIARCGVAAPGPTETECLEVDGVGWIPEELADGTRFTTFGTEPAIEVLVPGDYAPEGLLLPVFAAAARPCRQRPPVPLTPTRSHLSRRMPKVRSQAKKRGEPKVPGSGGGQSAGSAQAEAAGQGQVDELVDELGVGQPPTPPTSAGTSSSA